MFSTVTPGDIVPVRYDSVISRDNIERELNGLENSLTSQCTDYTSKGKTKGQDSYLYDALACKSMANCTEAVRLSLGGEIISLFEASEARSQAAYYASELIFMGVLFVKNPDMMSAFVEHDSEYPGRYWATSKSDTGKIEAVTNATLQSQAYISQMTVELETLGSRGGISDLSKAEVKTYDANPHRITLPTPSTSSRKPFENPLSKDDEWWQEKK